MEKMNVYQVKGTVTKGEKKGLSQNINKNVKYVKHTMTIF